MKVKWFAPPGHRLAQTLHRAILDALADSPGYAERGILTLPALEATLPLHAEDSLLYRAIYTIFRALPERLVPGTMLSISTIDTPEGVELMWEGKERTPAEGALRDVLASGPYGDLLELAVLALEGFCNMRAGYVESVRETSPSASSFERPPYIVRRVTALIPTLPAANEACQQRAVEAQMGLLQRPVESADEPTGAHQAGPRRRATGVTA
ncbi:MAG TPA: hypothetical protein VM582_08050 [Candidatus Thermoplasmatota archaeon]|nr:hypothetical protein [Candidatus Thermoplasmatota archaeon]